MVRSTFFGFATAQRALNASQKALDVTGQNMSNINTSGYTRQRLDLYSLPSTGIGGRYASRNSNNIGAGVGISQVSQIRDPFLDVRFRREAPKIGELDAKATTLNDLEAVFDETMVDGLGANMSDFVKQLQALSGKAGNAEFDGIAKASAEVMVNLFNQFSKQVSATREEQTYNLNDISITKVNDLLKNISELNKTIKQEQVHGGKALELMDQRNMYLDELSTFMNIDTKVTMTEISPGIVVEEFEVRLLGKDGTTTSLVDGDKAGSFAYRLDANGKACIDLKAAGQNNAVDVSDNLESGVFKGYLDMLNKSGEFDVPANTVRGIGYYEGMLDTIANKLATEMNILNRVPDPADPDAFPGVFIERPLFASNDPNNPTITAKNLCIADGWKDGTYGITASTDPNAGDGGNETITKMIALFSSKQDFMTPGNPPIRVFNGTFQECLANTSTVLALDVNSTKKLTDNYISVISGIDDMRSSVSAVSMDEEGINLLKYQKSYNAAARFMTTLDEAIDTIINKLGVVGR